MNSIPFKNHATRSARPISTLLLPNGISVRRLHKHKICVPQGLHLNLPHWSQNHLGIFLALSWAHKNLCMTFTNIFGFSSIFQYHEIIVKRKKDQKKFLFLNFWLIVRIYDSRPNKGGIYIWVPQILIDDWVQKGHTKLNLFPVFVDQILRLCCKQSKFNFWIWIHPKIKLLAICWPKQPPPDNQTTQFSHQVSKQFSSVEKVGVPRLR